MSVYVRYSKTNVGVGWDDDEAGHMSSNHSQAGHLLDAREGDATHV